MKNTTSLSIGMVKKIVLWGLAIFFAWLVISYFLSKVTEGLTTEMPKPKTKDSDADDKKKKNKDKDAGKNNK